MRTPEKIEPEVRTPAPAPLKHPSVNGEANDSFAFGRNQLLRRRVKEGYPSIRRTRNGAFVIIEQTQVRTIFGRTEGLKALAFFQTLLARRME